jgi:cell fate regulator YaaT (PSP1 superfamily)
MSNDINVFDYKIKTDEKKMCSCSCQKLETRDWLENVNHPDLESIPEIVEIRFKSTRKAFFKNPNRLRLKTGEAVMVDLQTGYDLGFVSLVSDLVKRQMKKRNVDVESTPLNNLIRRATDRDKEIWQEAKDMEFDTMLQARKYAKELNLDMKINDVEYQADKKKATFYYTAEGRVDFRELIKVFAKNFRVKIEMRQIGIRQEAGRVGGIGDCGRSLCCADWLTDFTTVPTIAAKQQNLYLNPSKLSGQCGRLKCCLNYELDTYIEALEDFPEEDIVLETKKASARVFKIDILKGVMWFVYNSEEHTLPIPITIENVKKIHGMNSKKRKPDDLEPFKEFIAPPVEPTISTIY